MTGEVWLPMAHVGSNLACGEATLSNPGSQALTADRLTVDGSLFLNSAEVTGEVRLTGARIGGSLECGKATFEQPRRPGAGPGTCLGH